MKLDQSLWTEERIGAMSTEAIRTLSLNADRLGAKDLVQRCAEELNRRAPRKPITTPLAKSPRRTSAVIGYHFVCKGDRGVIAQNDGGFRTGSWVVSQERVEQSLRIGAYLALHESKSEPSYRQGQIIGFQLTERSMLEAEPAKPQTLRGIEFLVEATAGSYEWVGDGSGEKGFKWFDPDVGGVSS